MDFEGYANAQKIVTIHCLKFSNTTFEHLTILQYVNHLLYNGIIPMNNSLVHILQFLLRSETLNFELFL